MIIVDGEAAPASLEAKEDFCKGGRDVFHEKIATQLSQMETSYTRHLLYDSMSSKIPRIHTSQSSTAFDISIVRFFGADMSLERMHNQTW